MPTDHYEPLRGETALQAVARCLASGAQLPTIGPHTKPHAAVKLLRRCLHALGYSNVNPTLEGVSGQVIAAVEDLQEKHGLLQDGITGHETWGWLAKQGGFPGTSSGGSLAAGPQSTAQPDHDEAADIVDEMLRQARACIGIREVGKNRGPEVEAIIREAGGKPGDAYCAWFCKAMRARACKRLGLPAPPFAISGNVDVLHRDAYHAGRLLDKPARGALLLIGAHGDFSHVGIIERVSASGETVYTIEGNTDGAGSGEGNGVWAKKRRMKPGYAAVRVV